MPAILTGAAVAAGWVAASAAEIDTGGVQTLRLQGTPSCYLALIDLCIANVMGYSSSSAL